ncbi:sugar MFS transporter [Aestuariibacter sp. A3R04]|nr:sugar MFS transporter [Aestuariibacter sp. A3R04]
MSALFFFWGFLTSLNDVLIPHLKSAFSLNYTQAMLVQLAFFGAYFLISLPAGKIIARIGFKRGIIAGLLVTALGCVLFYPAAAFKTYSFFLAGLFVLASGITILQVSANPYVAALGNEKTASSRLNFCQGMNSVGHTAAPFFGALFIVGAAAEGSTANPESVQVPYLSIALALCVVALFFKFYPLPKLTVEAHDANQQSQPLSRLFHHRHLVLGAVAIFLYVGAEVSVGSFIISFLADDTVAGLSHSEAAGYLGLYWGSAMVGRFAGSFAMRFINASSALMFNAFAAIALLITVMFASGNVAVWAVVLIGLCNSIMFPTLFSLGIRGLGTDTAQGAGLLCLAIVGGAIVPLLQGVVADMTAVQFSFVVPVAGYLYIAWYAKQSAHHE